MAMAVANADDERPGGKSPSGGKIGGGRKSSDFSQYRSLADFGYGFDYLGQLRQLSDGQPTELPFKFEVKPGNRAYNQRHYEALGEMLTEEVYRLLESSGLERLAVPSMVEEDGGGGGAVPQSFVFASPDYATADELLVLIHGSGVVRAGQWARRLIINESLGEVGDQCCGSGSKLDSFSGTCPDSQYIPSMHLTSTLFSHKTFFSLLISFR